MYLTGAIKELLPTMISYSEMMRNKKLDSFFEELGEEESGEIDLVEKSEISVEEKKKKE